MDKNKILVIIPAINLWDRYTKQCVDSVLASVIDVPLALCLIDNASTDGTEQKFEEHMKGKENNKNHFFVLRNEQNIGCAPAWNQGVKFGLAGGYTHFLIINNDILVSPNTIQAMFDRIQTVGTDGESTQKLLVSAIDVSGEVPVPETVLDISAGVNRKDPSEAPHPHFSCFMITNNTIDKVGFFDEQFYPAYFEDNSYHYRMKLIAGNDSAITITQGAFYHYGSRTQNEALGGIPLVPGDAFNANRQRFIKLWGNVPSKESFNHPYNDESLSAKLDENQNYVPINK